MVLAIIIPSDLNLHSDGFPRTPSSFPFQGGRRYFRHLDASLFNLSIVLSPSLKIPRTEIGGSDIMVSRSVGKSSQG